ncbi:hypothetical protein [Streptomyces griseocarneus]|uniref:hypothetical protein n=1 Tax=Streptomyces griseocarneus TaxID=51201 RepID=UPI00167E6226|nr:hypothetical protein [Streptomyces griseocarneus]MBZ6476545.1 hypothetical protein [Streptomyces griseocarneus]GHG79788.1 hypothetical protein GCM10018779_60840 [Streptomyces griseocarneus]
MTDDAPRGGRPQQRKQVLLRLDPLVHDALTRWANDELRSANAQIEFLLRKALTDAGRMPRQAAAMRRRGRPSKAEQEAGRDAVQEAEAEPGTS